MNSMLMTATGHQKQTPTTVNQILLEIIAQLGPEIRARQFAFDFDLDEVPLPHHRQTATTAIRGLLLAAIEHAPHRSEIAVNLIHSPDCWELEIALEDHPSVLDAGRRLPPGQKAWLPLLTDSRLVQADVAALTIGGALEFWRCPQGGTAIVLKVPQRGVRGAAQAA